MQATSAEAAVASAQASLVGSARWEWGVGDDFMTISGDFATLLGEPPQTDRLTLDAAFMSLDRRSRAAVRRALSRILQADVPSEVDHPLMLACRKHTPVHHVP